MNCSYSNSTGLEQVTKVLETKLDSLLVAGVLLLGGLCSPFIASLPAYSQFNKVGKGIDYDPAVYYSAYKALDQGYPRHALSLLDNLSSKPKKASVFALRSRCYEQLEDLPNALADIQKALVVEPNNLDYNLAYARILDKSGKPDQALDQCTKSIQKHSGDYQAWLLKAQMLLRKGCSEDAAEHADKAALLTQRVDVKLVQADCYLALKERAKSILLLQEAATLCRSNQMTSEPVYSEINTRLLQLGVEGVIIPIGPIR